MSDDDPMPWGKHKGVKMANVPADYLIGLHDNNKCSGKVLEYIKENMNILIKERDKK